MEGCSLARFNQSTLTGIKKRGKKRRQSYMNDFGFIVKERKRSSYRPADRDDDLRRYGEKQREFIDSVLDGKNTLMHGPAGTGKSAATKKLVSMLTARGIKHALCAPTGAAAVRIEGRTIHSLFSGLGLMKDEPERLATELRRHHPHTLNRLQHNIDIIVIDEISMVSSTFFDKIDKLFRIILNKPNTPFGGKQMVMSGDFYQLPPIETDDEGRRFVFESAVWKSLNLSVVNMTYVYRQSASKFSGILARMRVGRLNIEDLSILLDRVGVDNRPNAHGITTTNLFSTNKDTDTFNETELAKLDGDVHVHHADCEVVPYRNRHESAVKDLYRVAKDIRKHHGTPTILRTKVGAQVMLRTNMDIDVELFNGARGVITGFNNATGFPIVRFLSGIQRMISPVLFDIDHPDGVIHIRQIPLSLAWATTVHKSQGCTVDAVRIDTKHMFAEGQAYVAFSRVKSIDGLLLVNFDPKVVRVNAKVLAMFPPSDDIIKSL